MARKYEKVVTFAVTDSKEYAPMAESYGVKLSPGLSSLVVHAPMNDNIFKYQQGRQIVGKIVEEMLTTVLQGKAANGQVFGTDAPEAAVDSQIEHTEL